MLVTMDIGDGGIIRRFGFQECMDGPAPLASVRPPAALREVRLNGFPEALAEVLRHRVGAGRRHLRDTSPTGMSDAAYRGAGEGGSPSIPRKSALRRSLWLMSLPRDRRLDGRIAVPARLLAAACAHRRTVHQIALPAQGHLGVSSVLENGLGRLPFRFQLVLKLL